MKDNIILNKTFDFAVKIVELCNILQQDKKEYILSRQLLRSGTSIGANCEESVAAQSRKDFINKLYIALKESRETRYWLRLLKATGYLKEQNELFSEIEEIIKILTSIIKTTQEKDKTE